MPFTPRSLRCAVPKPLVRLCMHAFPSLFHKKESQLYRLVMERADQLTAMHFEDEVRFLRAHGFSIFPYPWAVRYSPDDVPAFFDERNGLCYAMHAGKRLYFPRGYDKRHVQLTCSMLFVEQDRQSAHRYFTDSFGPRSGDIFIDVGCAEAFSALEVVDTVSKVILLESDPKWKEALEATFAPYGDKVTLLQRIAGNETNDRSVRLDDLIAAEETRRVFLKIDVDGVERSVLSGAAHLLESHPLGLVCCLYHHQADEAELLPYLQSVGLATSLSEGYMLAPFGELEFPYFRRGVVRAQR